jgi:hypothetical protein
MSFMVLAPVGLGADVGERHQLADGKALGQWRNGHWRADRGEFAEQPRRGHRDEGDLVAFDSMGYRSVHIFPFDGVACTRRIEVEVKEITLRDGGVW